MFTRSDLSALMDAAPRLGVSIFLPTHVRGAETRQAPIRLKNLAAEARDRLLMAGLQRAEADKLLAPALALVEDYEFWQHGNQGLALFLGDGEARRHSFGMVSNAFIRVVNDATGREITRFDLAEDASTETAMIFGEVYRHNSEWKFRAVGQGYKGGLGPLAKNYGVNIG